MKIIFLDVDGVLNCPTTTERCGKYSGIDKNCLSRLKNVIDLTGAEIVLISTWKQRWVKNERLKFMQDELANYLDSRFAEKNMRIYDKTRDDIDDEYITRGEGIAEYVNRVKPRKFVIVDDMEFDYADCGLKNFLVKTDGNKGLLEFNTKKIIRMLGEKEN